MLSVINEEDVSILILCESGVGKSYLAQIIHEESYRKGEEFEEQNCGYLSFEKIDMKLNGWKRGLLLAPHMIIKEKSL